MGRLALLAVLIGSVSQTALGLQATVRPSSCTLSQDKAAPIRPGAGRLVYCALDVGSKNVKLSVLSMERGRNASLKDERQCKRALGLGAQVFDQKTGERRPLESAALDLLVDTIREFRALCTLDGGKMVGAAATQWARDAKNMTGVRAAVLAKTGLDIEVLAPAREGELGYLVASLGEPGRIVLDPGSNSFQITWQSKRTRKVDSITIPYGYVRASAADFEPASDYAVARRSFKDGVRSRINARLATLSPSLDLAGLKKLITAGELGTDLLTFGQDGAVAPCVRGLLRDANGRWLADAKAYDAAVGRLAPTPDPGFGVMSAEPIGVAELTGFLDRLGPADFRALSAEPIRGLYGQRALVVPVLVELLLNELGATRLVMLPQELSTGYLLSKIAR